MNNYIKKHTRQETNLKELENKNKQTLTFNQRKRNSLNYLCTGVFSTVSVVLGYGASMFSTPFFEASNPAISALLFIPLALGTFTSLTLGLLSPVALFISNDVKLLLSQTKNSEQALLRYLDTTNKEELQDAKTEALKLNHKQSSVTLYSHSNEKPELNGYYKISFKTITKPFRPRLLQITVEKTLFACDTSKLPKTITTLLEEQAKLRNEITLNHSNNNNTNLLNDVVNNTKKLVRSFNSISNPTKNEVLPLEQIITQMNEKLKKATNDSENLFKDSRINPNVLTEISTSMELSDKIIDNQKHKALEII